jgi:signal transduction histidine kinase
MKLRESLPARVALTTGGLLALILLVVTATSYSLTALMLRQGVDAAMVAALPTAIGVAGEALDDPHQGERDDHDHRRVPVLDPSGRVLSVGADLPVDPVAVEVARRDGQAFLSVVLTDRRWELRQGPAWWQALTPRPNEMRVMYALGGRREDPVVLQLATPLGTVSQVLPALLVRLLLLTALAVGLSGFIVWRMAGETYRPLRSVIETADDIAAHTLSTRIPDVWHDSTLRRLVRVLNAMVGRLQEAFETQGRFVAAAAHELRGPLAAMRAELEVTLRRDRPPAEYKAALAGALEETSRLSALSEHLLTLARYERGAGLAMERDLAVAPLLERAAEEARRSTGGEVVVSAPNDLRLDCDPLAMERLVSNLAKNGVQAGGSPVTITAEALADGLVISVRDRGPGIPPGMEARLFEPFYRADQARSRDGGTGLGLAIVKTVVEAHHGQITVESQPGQGAAFRVFLPRRQP